jgi:hypothetical protein
LESMLVRPVMVPGPEPSDERLAQWYSKLDLMTRGGKALGR